MATEDSRHNFKIPRWAYTLGDVLSSFAVEPPAQKKDDGWEPGVDVPVGEWWNYLHQQAGIWMDYAENLWGRRWTVAHVMRGGKGTNVGNVTAGVGLSVNVTTARVWIDDAMYQVPPATNLALAAADPTDDRFDLVVAQLNAGVPEYAVLTGVPDPAPAEPTPTTSQVPIARVRVNASTAVPGAITDRREFGVLELDKVTADSEFVAGSDQGDPVLRVLEEGSIKTHEGGAGSLDVGNGQIVLLLGAGMSLAGLVGDITLPSGQIAFTPAIVRKFDIPASDFRDTGVPASSTTWQDASVAVLNGSDPVNDQVVAGVRVPVGATITTARLYITRANINDGMTVSLIKAAKTTGTKTTLGTASITGGSGSTGAVTLTISGLSELVDQSATYYLRADWTGAGTGVTGIFSGEVEYTEERPFDGL